MRACRLLPLCLLSLFAACGGGGGSAPAAQSTALAYVDPPAKGWRWQRNAELSTPARLVLDLQGPGPDQTGRGVVIGLETDRVAAAWVPPGEGNASLVEDLAFSPAQPLQRWTQDGGLLRAGLFRRGRGNALALGGGLARVALALQPGAAPGVGVPLKVVTAQVLPGSGRDLIDEPCAVGTLTTQ